MPGKNAEIIVEDCLTLLLREMIRVLPEARPLAPETTRNPQVHVVVGASLHIAAPPGDEPTYPHIVTAMQGFKSGQLPSTVMNRLAKGFSDDEIKAIAAWYGAQKD